MLAKRFARYEPFRLEGPDPYDLTTLEELLPLVSEADEEAQRFGLNLCIDDFFHLENLSSAKQAIINFNQEIADSSYVSVQDNKHFRRFLAREFSLAKRLMGPSRDMPALLPALRDISIELSAYEDQVWHEKFAEVYEFIFDRVGFDDRAAETCILYLDYLGKDFFHFMRDFLATGEPFKSLPDISSRIGSIFGEERARPMINYISKKRSKDLLRSLADRIVPDTYLGYASKLDPTTGKKGAVGVLSEITKTYHFFKSVDAVRLLREGLEQMPEPVSAGEALQALKAIRRQYYSNVIGDSAQIPSELGWMLDNVLVAYYKQDKRYSRVGIQPALRLIASTYLEESPEAAFEAIRSQEANVRLRERYVSQGIDIDGYEKGIRRIYHLVSDRDQIRRSKERITSELGIIYDRLSALGSAPEVIQTIQEGSVIQQLEGIEKVLSGHEFSYETEHLKTEIKGHIHRVKSITGTTKNSEDTVEFYVSTDPLETLHMGQFFGSCLSLARHHDGMNAWASVVQTMDSNKNVIYAKGSNSNYVSRNRTALTDRGILCTRFYQNGGLFIEDAWVDYLTEFGASIGLDSIIPTKFAAPDSAIASSLRKAPKTMLEEVTMHIEPAYFSVFYGDGLPVERLPDGRMRITTKAYVIKCS